MANVFETDDLSRVPVVYALGPPTNTETAQQAPEATGGEEIGNALM